MLACFFYHGLHARALVFKWMNWNKLYNYEEPFHGPIDLIQEYFVMIYS